MKFPISWLKEFVEINLDTSELTHKLTMAGLEVEAIEDFGNSDINIVIAQIDEVAPHPSADKLKVCRVNSGNEILTIVCGAPNARVGLKAPLAKVGAKIKNQIISQANLRGVVSAGMLCSAQELELIGLEQIYPGLLELPDSAPIGVCLQDYLPTVDKIFTIKLTPNRGDCLSIIGLAREVSAIINSELTQNCQKWNKSPIKGNLVPDHADKVPVSINASDACSCYFGRVVTDINPIATTPLEMQLRLVQCGERAINPLVDITNFVMLETGQPTHAFDREKISKIGVRFADPQKDLGKFKLLIGEERELSSKCLLITENDKATAVAGVMGGADSAISVDGTNPTKKVFFESANFKPEVIQGRVKELMISSEAAYRFERGVDPQMAEKALERVCLLTEAICAGKIGELSQAIVSQENNQPITFRITKAKKLIGYPYSVNEVELVLTKLGFKFKKTSEGEYQVVPPSWRFDINREEDIIEEVARIVGYDLVEELMPNDLVQIQPQASQKTSEIYWLDLCKKLAQSGFHETNNFGFINEKTDKTFAQTQSHLYNPIVLENPLAENLSVMRSSIMSSLIENCVTQVRSQQKSLRIFEIARVFKFIGNSQNNQLNKLINAEDVVEGGQGKYYQPYHLGMLIWGESEARHWSASKKLVDYFELKGEFEKLFSVNNLDFREFSTDKVPAFLHPSRSAIIFNNNLEIGYLGELHPQISAKFEIPTPPIILECDFASLSNVPKLNYQIINRFPQVERDLSLLIPKNINVGDVISNINQQKFPLLINVQVFDVFMGTSANIPENRKNIGLRFVMQSAKSTLSEEEINSQIINIREFLKQKLDIELR